MTTSFPILLLAVAGSRKQAADIRKQLAGSRLLVAAIFTARGG